MDLWRGTISSIPKLQRTISLFNCGIGIDRDICIFRIAIGTGCRLLADSTSELVQSAATVPVTLNLELNATCRTLPSCYVLIGIMLIEPVTGRNLEVPNSFFMLTNN